MTTQSGPGATTPPGDSREERRAAYRKRRMCGTKRRYACVQAGMSAIACMKKKKRRHPVRNTERLTCYQCEYCTFFHVGSNMENAINNMEKVT